jgi:hypothetical protein
MKNCAITGKHFYDDNKGMLIPILIRKHQVESFTTNDNVMPFPIAVPIEYGYEEFSFTENAKCSIMLSMVSDIMGSSIDVDAFTGMRGKEKEVIYSDKECYLDYFICHQSTFNMIINDFKIETRYHQNKSKNSFQDFKEGFTHYVNTNSITQLMRKTNPTMPLSEILPVDVASGYVIPSNFNESHIDGLAEIRYINYFLNMLGKEWKKSMSVPYLEDCADAFTLLKNMS